MKILKIAGIVLIIALNASFGKAAPVKRAAALSPLQTIPAPPPAPPAPHKPHKPPFHTHLKWHHHRVNFRLPKLPPHPGTPPPPPAPPTHP